jgi:uncharacterized pyridoxal phosphate-containing UPF0001 family protein
MFCQELVDKSHDEELQKACPDIRWRFIGTCQSNKANKLMKCPNLRCIETVTSSKLADKLQQGFNAAKLDKNMKVDAMIQVGRPSDG